VRRTSRAWNLPVAIAVALLLVLVGAWLMYETRGTTLWFDEWLWALEHRDNSLRGFIAPHNGHPTLIPVVIYRLLFATVGIDQSAPYRAVGIAGHLLVVALLYVYSARRAGAGIGLLAAGAILLLGSGWQNIIWPLQIGWSISIACGLGALLALDRRDRAGDIAACVLLVICVAACGPGVAIAAGILVEVVRERGLRSAWIVAVPLALFAVWWLVYQDSGTVRRELALAPGFAADSAAATFSALAGLAGPLIGDDPTTLAWGRPLAVVTFALLLWRLWRFGTVPTRALTLLAILAAFWFLTAIQRAGIFPAASSRYVYVAGVFVVALVVELLSGVALSRRAWLVIGAAAVLIAIANVGNMRTGARFLREQSLLTRTGLAALEIARPVVRPGAPVTGIAGYPLVVVHAGDYFRLERDLGSPAASVQELANAPESARRAADDELTTVHRIGLTPTSPAPNRGAAPAVDALVGGRATRSGGCVEFAPAGAGPAQPQPALELTVPARGLVLTARGGGATVTIRRFADAFPDDPLGRISPGASGLLTIRPDRASQPWHVRVAPEARVTACGAPS
jgi:hypothetical protein